MTTKSHLIAWVTAGTKTRFAEIAKSQGRSASGLLSLIVDNYLSTTSPLQEAIESNAPIAPSGRLSVRLREDDVRLLRARAEARSLPSATYISFLIRGHLRNLQPWPDAELESFKRSIAELSATSRSLHQIARALSTGNVLPNIYVSKADLQAIFGACVALRDAQKEFVNKSLHSWEVGYEEADD